MSEAGPGKVQTSAVSTRGEQALGEALLLSPPSFLKKKIFNKFEFSPKSNLDFTEGPGSHLSFDRMHFEHDHTPFLSENLMKEVTGHTVHNWSLARKSPSSVFTFWGHAPVCSVNAESLLEMTMDPCRVLIFKVFEKNYTSA